MVRRWGIVGFVVLAAVVLEYWMTKVQRDEKSLVVGTRLGAKAPNIQRDLVLLRGLPVRCRGRTLSDRCSCRRPVFDRPLLRTAKGCPSFLPELLLQVDKDLHRFI
jgi:hypothetical protein